MGRDKDGGGWPIVETAPGGGPGRGRWPGGLGFPIAKGGRKWQRVVCIVDNVPDRRSG